MNDDRVPATPWIRADMEPPLSRGHAGIRPYPLVDQDVSRSLCSRIGARRRRPGAGVKAGRRPPGGLGLDVGEDVVILVPGGSPELVTVGVLAGERFSVSLRDA